MTHWQHRDKRHAEQVENHHLVLGECFKDPQPVCGHNENRLLSRFASFLQVLERLRVPGGSKNGGGRRHRRLGRDHHAVQFQVAARHRGENWTVTMLTCSAARHDDYGVHCTQTSHLQPRGYTQSRTRPSSNHPTWSLPTSYHHHHLPLATRAATYAAATVSAPSLLMTGTQPR